MFGTLFAIATFSVLVGTTVAAQSEGRKVALVIGNGDYASSTVAPLRNPPNDARDIDAALREIGFDVTSVVDATREEMGRAIDEFGRELRGADVGLFYFAGHGVQVEGSNYLIPVDARLPDAASVRYRALAADEVLAKMEQARTQVNLFFLDACRNNPLPQVSRSLNRGLAPVSRRPPETMIVYATGANDTAEDGTEGNSPFTAAFLNHVQTPGLDVYDLYRNVAVEVQEATDGEQRPEQFGNITRRYAMVPGESTEVASRQLPRDEAEPAPDEETAYRPMFGANPARTGEFPDGGPTEFHEVLFEFETGSKIWFSPAISEGTVYVGSQDHRLYAVDAQTGEEQWFFETGSEIWSSPVVAGGTVYVGSRDHHLYALDAQTGEERWSFETGSDICSSPAVFEGIVYVGSWDHHLYALDAQTGDEQWSFEAGSGIWSSPAVLAGTVYVGSSHLYAVDAETGAERWSFEAGSSFRSSPAISEGTVYVGSQDHHLYAVDAQTGEERWAFDVGREFETGGNYTSSPAIAGGTVYVGGGDNHLYAVDADTGEERWSFGPGGGIIVIRSSPAVSGETVYFANWDSHLYALNAETGAARWSFQTRAPSIGSPAVYGGVVYIGDYSGRLYAIR